MTTGTFPAAPTGGQTTEAGGRYYTYNATIGAWENTGAVSTSPTVASLTATANVNVTANVNAGNLISSGVISGTLSTAAQPNVTSLGNLTIANVDNIQLDASTISTTNTNGNLNITPNGTGLIVASNLRVSGTLSFNDATTQTTAGASPGKAIALAMIFG